MNDALLGIDLGTTAVKVGLFADDGRLLALSTQEYTLDTPRESWAELDAEVYWRRVAAGTAEVTRQAPAWRVAAIGLSSQGQTFVLLDAAHRPLRPAIVWLDTRAREEAAFLQEKLGAEALQRHLGVPFARPISSGPKLLWVKRHEAPVWAKVRHAAMLPEFIGQRLTGEYVCDPSNMGTTDFYGRLGWWPEALEAAGIPRELFGDVRDSGALLGRVTPEAASALGIEPGIPVGVGSNDQLTGALGVGNARPGLLSGAIGTAMAIVGTLPRDADLARTTIPAGAHAVPGLRYALTFSITTGILLKWYRDKFAPGSSYEELVRLAASVEPGAGGLLFLPHFAGIATPTFDATVRGGWIGLTLAHGPAHVVRALLEAVGFTVRDAIELLRRHFGREWTELRVLGGATRSDFWMQMIADISGAVVEKPACPEAAVLGAAICGGVAAGRLPGLAAASERFYRREKRFEPHRDAARYAEPYRRYRAAMEALYPGALGLG